MEEEKKQHDVRSADAEENTTGVAANVWLVHKQEMQLARQGLRDGDATN